MNVSLTPELEQFISAQVATGRYRSASEVVREGVRILQLREEEREAKLAALRSAVATGVTALDRGEGLDGDVVIREILAGLKGSEAA
jgi:antitoxin ParD1/3/4